MPNCILQDCNNNTGSIKKTSEGITFHKFPRPGQRERELWIKFVQENRQEKSWLPSEHSTICSKHFRDQDFYTTPKGRRFLKKSVVPQEKASLDSTARVQPKKNWRNNSSSTKLYAKNKRLRREKQLLRNRNRELKDVIKSLRGKLSTGSLNNDENRILNEVTTIETYIRSLKKNGQYNNKLANTPSVPRFKFSVNDCSAVAYKHPIKPSNNISSHGSFKADPGFTEEAFIVLELKSSIAPAEKPLVCSLVCGEMAIRQQELFKYKNLESVNYGTGPQEEKANEVLVLMLVSLTENWKIPVGYFLIAGISSEVKVKLIKICLEKSHKAGVKVFNVTFDGSETNFKVIEELGCNLTDPVNMKTYFPHPSTFENVYIYIDPCHVLKLIRDTFENKKMFFDENNGKIKWQLLLNLNKLEQNEELTFMNRLSPRLAQFRNNVMTMKLATQVLSNSITETLELCEKVLKSSQFLDVAGTIYFITLMNNLLDVFNSQIYHFYGYKSHICSGNKDNIFEFLNKVKTYILSLQIQVKQIRIIKRPNGDPRIIMKILKKRVIDTHCRTGFHCALICIESLKKLYCEMVEQNKIAKYISAYRLSREHLELFFASIRKNCGNNNPDAIEFREAYKKSLGLLQLRSTSKVYSLPIDNFTISATSSLDIINSTTKTNRYDSKDFSILQNDNKPLTSDIQASINCDILVEKLNNESSISESRLIIGFISGYVARKLMQELKCEECINNLWTSFKLWHHKLITFKDMGGLCYSSENVYLVCVKTEAIVRQLIREHGGQNLPAKYNNVDSIVIKALETFLHTDIFNSMSCHSLQQPCTFNHRLHLTRAIIEKYIATRLGHERNSYSNLMNSTKWYTLRKLILFQRISEINT